MRHEGERRHLTQIDLFFFAVLHFSLRKPIFQHSKVKAVTSLCYKQGDARAFNAVGGPLYCSGQETSSRPSSDGPLSDGGGGMGVAHTETLFHILRMTRRAHSSEIDH